MRKIKYVLINTINNFFSVEQTTNLLCTNTPNYFTWIFILSWPNVMLFTNISNTFQVNALLNMKICYATESISKELLTHPIIASYKISRKNI